MPRKPAARYDGNVCTSTCRNKYGPVPVPVPVPGEPGPFAIIGKLVSKVIERLAR